uniref:Uncharacterized protein n=1 Tax=Theropithecus gelada TaxID=9565 RepID=A0A8D2JTM1_THEGE
LKSLPILSRSSNSIVPCSGNHGQSLALVPRLECKAGVQWRDLSSLQPPPWLAASLPSAGKTSIFTLLTVASSWYCSRPLGLQTGR